MPVNRFRKSRVRSRRVRRMPRKRMTVGKVKRIISAELKVRDLGVGSVAIPTVTGDVTLVSNVGQGAANTQREGNWIQPVTFMGTITLEGNPAGIATQKYRVGCFQWKENNNVDSASLSKLMADTSAPHGQYNIPSKGSFKILWSRVGILSADIDNPQHQKILRFYVKPRLKILFDGAVVRKNHLFVFAYSNVATANDPPTYSFDTRLRFTDS